ncbi:MAG: hypothetical protein KAJ49_02035, partial [Arcobacteraceae bacterium]|nr:hypothetical protein [Arcobacteraceae bacterium]
NNMTNRFFKGGHSLYFNKNFYKKFWLPHILAQTDINMVDNRNHKWYFDITEFIFSFFDKAKYIIYIFAFLYVLVYSIGYII